MLHPEDDDFISTWLMPGLKFYKLGLENEASDSELKIEMETHIQRCAEENCLLAFVLLNKGATFSLSWECQRILPQIFTIGSTAT